MPQFEDGYTPSSLPTSSGGVITGACQYLGFTAAASGVSGVAVVLYDSSTGGATGPILELIYLGVGQSSGDHYPRPGRKVTKGIYASVSGGGTLLGSVFT